MVDTTREACVHVDVDDHNLGATLVQGEGKQVKIIAMAGRTFTSTECKCPRMERLLIAATWALKRWGK